MSSPEEKGPLELIARALVAVRHILVPRLHCPFLHVGNLNSVLHGQWNQGAELVVSVGAIVAAGVCIGTLNDFFGTDISDVIPGDNLLDETRGVSGWIIFVGIAAIILMLLFALLRIAGRGSTIVQAVGMVFSVLLGLGYLAGGVAAAIFAKDWDDAITLFEAEFGSVASEVDRIFASLAAASGLSLFSVVLLIVVVIASAIKK